MAEMDEAVATATPEVEKNNATFNGEVVIESEDDGTVDDVPEGASESGETAPSENGDTASPPPPPPPSGGWGTSAFEMMKDRATIARNHLSPQIQNMREKTSKRLPSLDKVKSSASAAAVLGRERMQPALNRVKEGSTQGWSMFKTKLASAAPVAEKIQTMGLQVVLGDTNVELVIVENPKQSNCRFLKEHKSALGQNKSRGLSLIRTLSSGSVTSAPDLNYINGSPAERCLENPYILGNILLLCGNVQDLGRMALINNACRKFIKKEKRLWRFCVRYGEIPPSIRIRFWEHAASVASTRQASEHDFDTYLHMALSKGEWTELILTDVRRTYGRVAPHKRPVNGTGEIIMDTEQELINQLSEILHALSGRFPEVGYCQGMDYIAAHVLDNVKKSSEAREFFRSTTNSSEYEATPVSPSRTSSSAATRAEVESAFWILVSLFENYRLRQMFSPGLHRLHLQCFQCQRLFEVGFPRLAEHFEEEKVMVEMFTVGWFQTLFLYLNVLPRETLDRIWDIFLFENNWKIMHRVALALLQLSEEHIISKPIDEVMQFLNTFAHKLDEILAPDVLIPHALAIKVTNTVLNKLQKQYMWRKKSPK